MGETMRSYVNEQLLTGERVQYKAETHWAIYMSAYFWTAMFVVGMLSAPPVGVIFIPFIAIAGIRAAVVRATTELGITDRRVIAKFGFIARYTYEKHLDRLEGINYDQSIMGRMLGYGTIRIGGMGGNPIPVPFISNPELFKRALNQAIESQVSSGSRRNV